MALISDNIVDHTPNGPRLVGGRSRRTGEIVFPVPDGAEAARYERVHLKTAGTLWSFTVQRFPPKSPPFLGVTEPARFEPYAVGYVELEGEVIVETRIVAKDLDALRIGAPMMLTTVTFPRGDAGEPIETYAFTPDL
ncbi:MAG: OB-fold domain-containing protein [Caulobacterales bacterium]|nr:OB-fold domain-containing protein [Caulobacterales bacterium]